MKTATLTAPCFSWKVTAHQSLMPTYGTFRRLERQALQPEQFEMAIYDNEKGCWEVRQTVTRARYEHLVAAIISSDTCEIL